MKAVVQRVSEASVRIDGQVTASIRKGFLVLLGIHENDTEEELEWLAAKIAGLRIFADTDGHMNLSLKEAGGEVLLVSQFTLYASTRKGNRPSFMAAAKPEKAVPLYEKMITRLEALLERPVKCGIFGADMKISLVNDGPVTIVIDSLARE